MDFPGDVADLLRFLIRRLDEEIEAGDARVEPPALLRLDGADVACAVGGIDLHAKPLDGHPADVLAGFTAPPEWFAVGVLTGGWNRWPGTERRRVRVTTFVCRDGTEVAAVRHEGGELEYMESRGVGVVLDTLRRVVEVPTDPADVTVVEWMAKCWLQLIGVHAKRGRRASKWGWPQAVALHPAVLTIGARPDELAAVTAEAAANMTWEGLREAAADAGDDEAAWMDAGMFARRQVHGRPPLAELLKRVGKRVTPEARAKINAALVGWELLDQASVA